MSRTLCLCLCLATGCSGAQRWIVPSPDDTDTVETEPPEATPAPEDTETPGQDTGDTVLPDGAVVINELLAANDDGLTNRNGDADDWVELYNATEQHLDLGGWSLASGDEALVFPPGTFITRGGYLLVWCDEDPDGEGHHAPFALSREADAVRLVHPTEVTVDEVRWGDASDIGTVFDEQQTDISLGRVPDGGTLWGLIDPPTPIAPNAP